VTTGYLVATADTEMGRFFLSSPLDHRPGLPPFRGRTELLIVACDRRQEAARMPDQLHRRSVAGAPPGAGRQCPPSLVILGKDAKSPGAIAD
jgi:hypothetical protein